MASQLALLEASKFRRLMVDPAHVLCTWVPHVEGADLRALHDCRDAGNEIADVLRAGRREEGES